MEFLCHCNLLGRLGCRRTGLGGSQHFGYTVISPTPSCTFKCVTSALLTPLAWSTSYSRAPAHYHLFFFRASPVGKAVVSWPQNVPHDEHGCGLAMFRNAASAHYVWLRTGLELGHRIICGAVIVSADLVLRTTLRHSPRVASLILPGH